MAFVESSAVWPSAPFGRWAHWSPQVLVATIVATIALVFRPLPASSPFALLVPLLLVGVLVMGWLGLRHHDRQLCEHCLSAMPLNPSESAVRYRRRLAVTHLGQDRRLVAAYLLLLLGSHVLLVVDTGWLAFGCRTVWAAVQCTMIYLVQSHATHRRLQPWCPGCSDGGGGEDVGTHDPIPSGSRHG